MKTRLFYEELIKKLQSEARVPIGTWLSGPRKGEKEFLDETMEAPGLFTECLNGRITVVICGGGHVSLALEKVLKTLDLSVIIVDDRPEFANKDRFRLADQVYCMDFKTEFPNACFPENSYYIIVTRGHENDYQCLKQILKRSYDYVGMIGSRKKVAGSFAGLAEEGVSKEEIEKIYAPIGLPIGGNTPAEIAVSIAAQLIQVKEQTKRNELEAEVADVLRREKDPLVMVTVLEKEGSSPRGKGSRMLVGKEGLLAGSIGGGAIEFAAIQEARKALGQPCFEVREYDLSDKEAAGLGMICGGRVKVLFEDLT